MSGFFVLLNVKLKLVFATILIVEVEVETAEQVTERCIAAAGDPFFGFG